MSNRRLTRNAIMTVVQVLISGLVLFFLYRYLLGTLGAEKVGIWSIVLATVSTSKISELGLTASAVKFVAKYIALNEKDRASDVIQTTALTLGGVFAIVLVTGYPIISWMMKKFISSNNYSEAIILLPFALGSMWIGTLSGVFQAGLDGCQRIDLRVISSLFAMVIFLIFAWILVPTYGLIGLAWAQIFQGILTFVGNWILLRREIPTLPIITFKWRYQIFREMFSYGFNFQITSITIMLVDPVTKLLLAKFGGLSSVAYFEMASRMVNQFRSLLVSANQVIIPYIAEMHETDQNKIQNAYLDSYKLIFFLSLPLYVGIVAISPLVSDLWIGHFEKKFVITVIFLSAGFLVNALTNPAYFVNLGTGSLRWNTLGHICVGLLNIIFGYIFGFIFGGNGVVIGYVISLSIGSLITVIGYHRDSHIPLHNLLPEESRLLLISGCVALLMASIVFYLTNTIMTAKFRDTLVLVVYIAPVFGAMWLHPLRMNIVKRVITAFQG